MEHMLRNRENPYNTRGNCQYMLKFEYDVLSTGTNETSNILWSRFVEGIENTKMITEKRLGGWFMCVNRNFTHLCEKRLIRRAKSKCDFFYIFTYNKIRSSNTLVNNQLVKANKRSWRQQTIWQTNLGYSNEVIKRDIETDTDRLNFT